MCSFPNLAQGLHSWQSTWRFINSNATNGSIGSHDYFQISLLSLKNYRDEIPSVIIPYFMYAFVIVILGLLSFIKNNVLLYISLNTMRLSSSCDRSGGNLLCRMSRSYAFTHNRLPLVNSDGHCAFKFTVVCLTGFNLKEGTVKGDEEKHNGTQGRPHMLEASSSRWDLKALSFWSLESQCHTLTGFYRNQE